MDTVDNAITKPVHRLEVFTGGVAGGRLLMRTRRGSSRRLWPAATLFLVWRDGMDCRLSNCLAGDVNCEHPQLDLLKRMSWNLCQRSWM